MLHTVMTYLSTYLVFWPCAFTLTILTEGVTAWLLNKYHYHFEPSEFFTAFIVGNALSHPFLWFIMPKFMPNYTVHLIFGELFVYLFEAFVYYLLLRKISMKQALIISTIQNTVSLAIGLWISSYATG